MNFPPYMLGFFAANAVYKECQRDKWTVDDVTLT